MRIGVEVHSLPCVLTLKRVDGIFGENDSTIGGRLKFFSHRTPVLPNVTSMAESGMTDVNLSAWTGPPAPAKTPQRIIDQLNKAVLAAMDADLKVKLFESGIEGPPARPAS